MTLEANRRDDAGIDFMKLTRTPEAILDEFYTDVLLEAFPADELESLEDFKDALDNGADGILAFIDGRVAGGLVYEHYVRGSVLLLGYLVVRRDIRGRGLGAKLLRLGMRQTRSTLALGEIEDPRFWPTSEHSDPYSRLRFWARENCKMLPLAYVQPALRPESERVRRLLLIAIPREHESLPESVPGHLVAMFLREYFLASEGSISEGDSEFQELVAACSVERLHLSPLDLLLAETDQ